MSSSSIMTHFRENYLLYLTFVAIFLIVLVAFQNRNPPNNYENRRLSENQRTEVKELIEDAMKGTKSNLLFWSISVIIFVCVCVFYFYNRMRLETQTHQNIKNRLRSLQTYKEKQNKEMSSIQ